MIEDYKQSESWKRQGKNFLIEVKHYIEETTQYCEREHHWNVYAYIYPKHPHFAKFDGTEKMWQDAASALPLHAGPSFCRIHVDHKTGAYCSYQVGSDYSHLHDDHFSHYATPNEAYKVFEDADHLFDWLSVQGAG